MRRKVLVLVGLMIGLGALLAGGLTSSQSKTDAATPVIAGQHKEKHKEFAKEYARRYADFKGKSLKDVARFGRSKGGRKEARVSKGVPSLPIFTEQQIFTAESLIKDLTCTADLVVIGVPTDKESAMTEDETFAFTDYEFNVSEVLKGSTMIEPGSQIRITRPGGLIELDGQTIRIEDKSYNQLDIGTQYLLFLQHVEGAKGYAALDARGDFQISGSKISTISGRGMPGTLRDADTEGILGRVRVAKDGGCSEVKEIQQ